MCLDIICVFLICGMNYELTFSHMANQCSSSFFLHILDIYVSVCFLPVEVQLISLSFNYILLWLLWLKGIFVSRSMSHSLLLITLFGWSSPFTQVIFLIFSILWKSQLIFFKGMALTRQSILGKFNILVILDSSSHEHM